MSCWNWVWGDMVFDFWSRWNVAFWKIWWKGRWACRWVGCSWGVQGFRRRMSLALLHSRGRREWANLQVEDMLSNCWWRAEDLCVRERSRNLIFGVENYWLSFRVVRHSQVLSGWLVYIPWSWFLDYLPNRLMTAFWVDWCKEKLFQEDVDVSFPVESGLK